MSESKNEEAAKRPISNGPNARPRGESIAQTADGLPNDSERPVEIDPQEEERIRKALLRK